MGIAGFPVTTEKRARDRFPEVPRGFQGEHVGGCHVGGSRFGAH